MGVACHGLNLGARACGVTGTLYLEGVTTGTMIQGARGELGMPAATGAADGAHSSGPVQLGRGLWLLDHAAPGCIDRNTCAKTRFLLL